MASQPSLVQPENQKSQYHHYIPRFILRNFAHPFRPLKTSPQGSKKSGKRRQKGYRPGEQMLYSVNLAEATIEIIETPVSRTFGLTDMYRDFANATNQHYLEELLSGLESRAGGIVSTIRKAFEAGNQEVWITRTDRDVLRKFLFIMKYRGTRFRKRFYHQRIEDYNADDREKLQKYMREKGFQKPADVWFDNIKAMLELKMDPKRQWIEELRKRAYPDDAEWFTAHTQMMYLALCTPSSQDDEFLLTENAYNIHEGPVSLTMNPDTGAYDPGVYTEFHVFAPVSPKLMIVLRSFVLPQPLEDSNEGVRDYRETMYKLNAIQHNNPNAVSSFLDDLPVAKALNSYSKIVDGKVIPLDGEDGTPRAYHKFCFRFFPISAYHVNKINCVMLEESYAISTIVFDSRSGARKALDHYLSMPCERSFKTVSNAPDDPRLALLKKLELLVKQLGSSTTALYQVQECGMDAVDVFQEMGKKLADALLKEPTQTMKLYMKLGGNAMSLLKDTDQARRMLTMRIKIDVLSKGLGDNIRQEIRDNLRILFCELPARRVWMYLKEMRNLELGRKVTPPAAAGAPQPDLMSGPEDAIANASHLIRDAHICRLMHHATLNQLFSASNLNAGWGASVFVFSAAGSIGNCGISELEQQARLYREIDRISRFYKDHANPLWTVEENVEMAVRILLRRDFSKILGGRIASPDLEALEKVLFDTVYPTLGSR